MTKLTKSDIAERVRMLSVRAISLSELYGLGEIADGEEDRALLELGIELGKLAQDIENEIHA